MKTYLQLQSQIEKLQKEALAVRKRELSHTIERIKEAIAAFGLTPEDLGFTTKKKKTGGNRGRPAKPTGTTANPKLGRRARGAVDKRSVVAPKYRDAATGATWTGRGKYPRWLADAIAGGKKIEDYKI